MDRPGIKQPKRKINRVKNRKWFEDEVDILVASMKDNYYLKSQGGHKRQNKFHSSIRDDLQLHGYDRTVHEIMVKIHCLLSSYRREKRFVLKNGSVKSFRHFFDFIDVEKMELQNDSPGTESEEDPSVSTDGKGEGIDTENGQVMDDNLLNYSHISGSDFQLCSRENSSGEKEPDEDVPRNSIDSSHSPHPDLQTSPEDVLLGFFKAFRNVHRQLKRNDATLLTLFREQNEIFKTQTALMYKLISQQ